MLVIFGVLGKNEKASKQISLSSKEPRRPPPVIEDFPHFFG